MQKFPRVRAGFAVFLLLPVMLGACAAQPPGAYANNVYVIEVASAESGPLSVEERLRATAKLCPDGTKPYCRIGPNRDQCSCVADVQMRRNLETFMQR
ncbi:MAG: hypothetical protein ACR2QS_16775 [Woeseiaceae bacterium]